MTSQRRMVELKISVVIPAYNEAATIGSVIAECERFCDEIIVVDDGSTDLTGRIARNKGATVIRHEKIRGVTKATQDGIQTARGDIIITMDADGQHHPLDIPRLTTPIINGKADLTLGVRAWIPHASEKMINQLTNLKVRCTDVGTGFRAIKREIAKQLRLHGTCLCGTFILEAHEKGARIIEVPINVRSRASGRRRMKTRHIRQFFYVLKDILLP